MREHCALTVAVLVLAVLKHPARAWTTTSLPSSALHFSSCRRNCCARGGASSAATATTTCTPRVTWRHVPTCKLERLPRRTLKRAVPLRPTTEKWVAHFGQTATERLRKLVDALAVAFVFFWTAFFASRTLLGPLAWRAFGLVVFLQAFLRPLVESYNHALELWGAGGEEARRKIKGALFTGRVSKTGTALSSEASDHRTHFQMLVEDEEGRELLFDVPQVPEYRDIRRGMRCEVVVLSRSSGFAELTGVTEAYVPELDIFVGRFPLLDKRVFWDLLDARNERDERGDGNTITAREERTTQGGASRGRSPGDDGADDHTGINKHEYKQQWRDDRHRVLAGEDHDKRGLAARRARMS